MKTHRWLFTLALVLWSAGAARDKVDAWVAATDLPSLVPQIGTEVMDRNGQLLRAYTVADGRWRLGTDLGQIDPQFIAMLLAYEDKRFWAHSGVDGRAVLRAAWQSAKAGRVVSGASTLTMQVARLLEDSGTGAWAGKLRQVRVAWALEQRLSKADILTLYLHLAPYGGNLEGVRAASLAWFGKPPRRLTPAQSALLVALPQSPSGRRPDRFTDAAVQARARVLARAKVAGVLEQEEVQTALSAPLPRKRLPVPQLAPHLSDRLAAGTSAHRIETSVDAGLQQRLEDLVRALLVGQDTQISVAIVVAETGTGKGLASVGAGEYGAQARLGFVDMSRALRSPGSTLKPLIYGLGFQEGLIHPATLIDDRPRQFGSYAPQNFDRVFRGTLPVSEALQLSLNLPVVEVLDALGPAQLMAALRTAGVDARVNGAPGLAVGLGGLGVSLEGLVQLFGAFPNGGLVPALHWTGPSQPPRRLLGPVAAWQVADILAEVPPPAHAPRGRIGYKTGTSYGHRDAWAIGFDGAHVVGVWFGRPDGTPVPGVFGAELAAPALFEVFARIGETTPLPPPPPETLLLSNASLPRPLQRFSPRGAVLSDTDAPRIAFPPDGAVLEMTDGLPLMPRVVEGTAPFTWFLNGTPAVTGVPMPTVDLGQPKAEFIDLMVVDAEGRSASAQIELRLP